MIGPRINAGGRLSECDLGARLLSTTNLVEAGEIAEKLNLLNEERKEVEREVLEEALQEAEKQMQKDPTALIVAGEGWHEGVIGIRIAVDLTSMRNEQWKKIISKQEQCSGSRICRA